MRDRPKIAITGLGAVTAAGKTPQAIWEAVRSGRSGLGPIQQWDASSWPCKIAGEIQEFNPRELVSDRKLHKMISRGDLLGLNAAFQALDNSDLLRYRDGLGKEEQARLNERTAVVVASGGENYRNQHEFFPLLTVAKGSMKSFGEELTSAVNPMWLLRSLPNNVLCYVGVTTGIKGPNANFTSHSGSGSLAVLEAGRILREGEADRVLVVGYDSPVEPQAILYFERLGILSSDSIRPFDARRDGSILGEGAGALVLETLEAAERRGAHRRGEFLGGAVTAEGEGLLNIRQDGNGVARALRLGLADASMAPEDISMVAAHGNGTIRSDLSEGRAILEVFGRDGPPVISFKWAVGHLLAASGILEAVLSVLALEKGEAPGIPTLEHLDPELAGLQVSREHRKLAGNTAVLIGRGFGGISGALLFKGSHWRGTGNGT